jgi:hypothetical protein
MSWWETYAGWRAHRGKIEALGLLPVIAAAAWEIFFVQWNANQIAYGRYYDLNHKLDVVWQMLEPTIWDIHNHPAGTLAQPDPQEALTRWHSLASRFGQEDQQPSPPSLHSGFFTGVRFTLFLIGSILVALAKALTDEENPLAPRAPAQPEPAAQLAPIDGGQP